MGLMNITLAQELTCSMCGQSYKENKRLEVAARIELFGTVGFKICPRCQQEVPKETMEDKLYQKKAIRFIANKRDHLNLQNRRRKDGN